MTVDEAFRILESLPAEWGASEEEVHDVESRLGVRLPTPLRELMLRTGREMHMRWLFPDDEISPLNKLIDLQELAAEILEGDPPSLRPTFPFVTLSVPDGYGFSFALAGHVDIDTEVLWYQEGRGFERALGRSLRSTIAGAIRRALCRD